MYGALLCSVAYLVSVVIDHYDKRDNETDYKFFAEYARKSGWVLFFAALVLSVVKHTQDYVCENREIQRIARADGNMSAITFNRYCALHNPSNALDPGLQVMVVPANFPLSKQVGNAVILNRTDIDRIYWKDIKLIIEYHPQPNATGDAARPWVKGGVPVPVELVNTRSKPSFQGLGTPNLDIERTDFH